MGEQEPGEEIVWCDGVVSSFADAHVRLEDRGFIFGDGVYEVVRVYGGAPFALAEHLARLERSAAGVMLRMPVSLDELARLAHDLIGRSRIAEAELYIQLTRGAARRNPLFPMNTKPTVVVGVRHARTIPDELYRTGIEVCLLPDERWGRCDLKTICLLPNVLAKNRAVAANYFDAIMVRDAFVTEGTASNVFVVREGNLLTSRADNRVLSGVTRHLVIELARAAGVHVVERDIHVEELTDAAEIFLTSTMLELLPVTRIDKSPIGAGTPGDVYRDLHAQFQRVTRRKG